MYNQYLAHHGILGMRWGHRKSGASVTRSSSGSKKMSDEELQTSVKRMNLEKQYKELSKQSASKTERAKKLVDATSGLVNQAQKLNNDSIKSSRQKMDLSHMTDQQLRDRINRSNLEKQYNDMFGSEVQHVSKGKQYTTKILDTAGTALALGGSALTIALSIKELRK